MERRWVRDYVEETDGCRLASSFNQRYDVLLGIWKKPLPKDCGIGISRFNSAGEQSCFETCI